MVLTIQLPNTIADTLRKAAKHRQLSPEMLAVQIIEEALAPERALSSEDPVAVGLPSLEEIVAKIQALPRDPGNIRPATTSLEELLANSPEDPNFDLAEWQREWELVEREMKEIERADRERDEQDRARFGF